MKKLLLMFGALFLTYSFYAQVIISSGSTVTYSSNVSFNVDIIIEPSATLIIDGASISMGPGTHIYIKDRGLLKGENGGEITGFIGQNWRGIRVDHTSVSSVNPNKAIDFSEMTISNAIEAISTGLGGRERTIVCTKSTFINNGRHLYISASPGNLQATGFAIRFDNCEFLKAGHDWPIHLSGTKNHSYTGCTIDLGSNIKHTAMHIDAGIRDSEIRNCTFKHGQLISIYLHHDPEGVVISDNIFEIEETGTLITADYQHVAIWFGETGSPTSVAKNITIFNNEFTSSDPAMENKACGIYSQSLGLVGINIVENQFLRLHTGIDINNNNSSKYGSTIRLNNFDDYINGIVTRDNNSNLWITCNKFSTNQSSPTGIWNRTGTLQNHTGIGRMNEFFSPGVDLRNTGNPWQYSTTPSNINSPTSIVGSILMTSVIPAESCKGSKKSVSQNSELKLDNVQKYTLFPNPSNGEFTLDFHEIPSEAVQIILTDITGRVIKSGSYIGQKTVLFDITNETSGIYRVTITTNEISETKRAIIN